MAVRNRKAVKIWRRDGSTASGPLVRYIDSMEIVGRRGEFELLKRQPSATDAVTGVSDRDGGR